jgi:hypothetical protein
MRIEFSRVWTMSTVLVSCISFWSAHANGQSHFGDPHAGLAIHGAGDAAAFGQTASGLYKAANDELGKWLDLASKNKLDAQKPDDVAKTYVQIQQMGRAARYLHMLGEPAGPDYQMRYQVLSNAFSKLFEPYRNSQNFAKAQALARATLVKNANARAKKLEAIQKLVKADKIIEAEKEMDEAMDTLDSLIIFVPTDEVATYTTPFLELRTGYIDRPARELRIAAGQKMLAATRDGVKAEGANSVEQLVTAAEALKTAASVDLNGNATTGPQLVGVLEKTLLAEHAAMLRRRSTEMARASALEQNVETPDRKAIEDHYAALSKQLLGLLPAIIAAEAARATEAEAGALYSRHLEAATKLLLKTTSDLTKEATKKSLAALAAKTPNLAAEAANEEAMAREYLKWQKRTAATLAKAKAKEFAPIYQVFGDGTMVDAMTYSDGLFNTMGNQPNCYFYGASPRVIAAAQPKLAGKSVTVENVFPLEAGGSGVSRYANRTIAMIALPDFSAEATALQTKLLGEGKTPKSLEVSMAIEGTKRGWLRGAGGVVEELFVEAVITRFAKTPEAIAQLVPVGSWNDEPNQPLLKHALGRFVIKPSWYQGEYFFVVAQ